ncbi:MAG: LuxR C-terminal-related transcriptional regulator [Treponema sp.]|jgi:LuxR family maltose regulon positive regulatory protein|nr:LuxR C-terminal-related transcriptional regulator [Treponema sp.]
MSDLIHSTAEHREGNRVYLARPRIHLLLEEAVRNPVVTVIAGAGYGKTQAVYSFLQSSRAITAWLQFSERDNMPDCFWENFAAAVGFINKDSERLLREEGFPGTERRFDRYLSIPRKDIIPHARYIFVYDDLHLIHNQEVLRFIEHSILTPFPNIVSIIISRLNVNMKTAGAGQPARINGEDLRFTEEETAEYFHLQGIKVNRQTSSAICRDTEGWAFALHLSALFLKRLPVPDYMREGHGLPGMRSNIFRLLETELMDSISPGLRKFLIKLSLTDFLPQEFLEFLNPGKELIEEMKKIGSFIRWDSYSGSYIIHHLFLEYLTLLQGELTPAEKREVYRGAAGWYLGKNRRIDALSCYEKAGDYDSIIDIIDQLPTILPDHTAAALKELLDRAPKALYRKHPLVRTLYAKICLSLDFFTDCVEILRRHIRELEKSPSPLPGEEKLRLRALLSSYVYLGFAGYVTSTDTADYSYVEDLKRAASYRALGAQVPMPLTPEVMLGSYICRVRDGDPEKVIPYLTALDAGVPYSVQAFGGCCHGMADLAWGEYLYFKAELPGAEARLREALRKSREQEQHEVENRSLFYLLRIALYRGSTHDIGESLKGIVAQGKQECYIGRSVHCDIIMGWYYTQIGEPERIAPWLKNDFEDSDINNRSRGLEILVKAKYHLCKKNYPAALASVSERKDFEGGLLFGRLETLALEAVCRYAERDQERALGCLKELYETGVTSGVVMPLNELGRFARALTDWALKQECLDRAWLLGRRRNAAAYAKKLFSAAGARREERQIGKNRNQVRSPIGRRVLSRREWEVLDCLSRGLTRQETAGTLSLSINTVKSLIRSVYNKLGVVNRSHAVRAAASMGLLEKAE